MINLLRSLRLVASFSIAILGSASLAAPATRIGITTIGGKKAFFDTVTGVEFVPKGYNYTLVESIGTTNPNCQRRHVTFDVNKYRPDLADAFLAQMHYDGYNTVRVFIDVGDVCRQAVGQYSATPPSTSTPDVYGPYVANVADFLTKAKARNIRAILVVNYTPQSWHYQQLIGGSPEPHNQIEGEHRYLLTAGGHQAKAAYMTAFINELKKPTATLPAGELLPTVLAYELQNEVAVFDNIPPFSLSQGMVTFGNGLSYNMGIAADRQQAVDANIVQWAIVARNAAKVADPGALVSASVFTFGAVMLPGPTGIYQRNWRIHPTDPAKTENRHPARVASLHLWSTLDFTDIHAYKKSSLITTTGGSIQYTLAGDLATSEFSNMNLTSGKPVLMGEFGALKSVYGCTLPANLLTAATSMGAFRSQAKTLGFKGALFWAWDTTLPNQTSLPCVDRQDWWNGIDYNGAINGVLAGPF